MALTHKDKNEFLTKMFGRRQRQQLRRKTLTVGRSGNGAKVCARFRMRIVRRNGGYHFCADNRVEPAPPQRPTPPQNSAADEKHIQSAPADANGWEKLGTDYLQAGKYATPPVLCRKRWTMVFRRK